MMVKYTTHIDGYKIITMVTDASPDPEKTKEEIAPLIKKNMREEDIERLYTAHLRYANPGENAENIPDALGGELKQKLADRGEHRLLLDPGREYIDNYTGVEYWLCEAGTWVKKTIQRLGVSVPAGAYTEDTLPVAVREEIRVQQEAERIADLTPEQRAKEKESRLEAALEEADGKNRKAQIKGEIFNASAWYQARAAEIELKYA